MQPTFPPDMSKLEDLTSPITLEVCRALDAADPLAPMRGRFKVPPGVVYLDGNSLGAMPRNVPERMRRAVEEEWALGLIGSWNDAGWYLAPKRIGARIAALVGAHADEVVACDSTSVNLFKVVVAAMRLRPGRSVVLAERGNFPTDVYIDAGAAELLGAELVCVEPSEVEGAIARLGPRLAVVQLTHVHYKSGRRYDMEAVTAAAHAQGALMVWDLAHSAGAMPVHLEACGADFAVGCSYKYLNGGPGAPAWVYVARRHQDAVRQPLAGWLGHARPFDFEPAYRPAAGTDRMLCGTPPQLSMIALEAALEAFDGVDLTVLRAKSEALGDLFIRLAAERLDGFGFGLASPRDSRVRGSQVSLTHPEGYAIMQALIARGVIGDFRAPDILRFGFAVLYLRYEDAWDAVDALRDIMLTERWRQPEFSMRKAVT